MGGAWARVAVNRGQGGAKGDRPDAAKLVRMLLRYHNGEKKVWSVVHVPSAVDEDRRQLHRDLLELKAERTQHVNRIKGLLAGCGLAVALIGDDFPTMLAGARPVGAPPGAAALHQAVLAEVDPPSFRDLPV